MVALRKTPDYDAAGNMISGPKPGDETTRVHYIYDAWNRLTEVRADDSGNPGDLIATYSYDGLNRRIEKEVTAGSVDTHYYYNHQWQMLEERQVDGQLPADADVQYVWGAKYVDDLILRDRDTNANGTMDERLYALADANYNVTALFDESTGAVVERFLYDAYGTVTELDPDDFTPYTGTDYDWQYTYSTRRLDEETGLMYYRARYCESELGRFVSRDPIGYEGGDVNLYAYVGHSPVARRDPSGLLACNCGTDQYYEGGLSVVVGDVRDCSEACSEAGGWWTGEINLPQGPVQYTDMIDANGHWTVDPITGEPVGSSGGGCGGNVTPPPPPPPPTPPTPPVKPPCQRGGTYYLPIPLDLKEYNKALKAWGSHEKACKAIQAQYNAIKKRGASGVAEARLAQALGVAITTYCKDVLF